MDGYYEHAPTVVLTRPLAFVGLPGSGAEEISRRVALLTGLPWAALDRGVEHRAGCSLDGLILRAGEDARLAHEREVLPALLRQPMPPVLALGDTTLTDPSLVDLLTGVEVRWVFRPLPELVARLQARVDAQRAHRWSLLFGEADARVLGPVFALREGAMRERADGRIEASGLSDHAVAMAETARLSEGG